MLYWRAVCLILLLTCLASFYWGIRRFFSQPSGMTFGMRAVQLAGMFFTLVHVYALLASPRMTSQGAALAGLVYLGALGLFWWAYHTHGRRPLSAIYSTDVPAHLVQDGPYRYIRHPFYTSYLLAWLGACVATTEWYLFATFVIMLIVYLRAAWEEEAKFGGSALTREYETYRARTGLFLPSLRVLRRAAPRSGAS